MQIGATRAPQFGAGQLEASAERPSRGPDADLFARKELAVPGEAELRGTAEVVRAGTESDHDVESRRARGHGRGFNAVDVHARELV